MPELPGLSLSLLYHQGGSGWDDNYNCLLVGKISDSRYSLIVITHPKIVKQDYFMLLTKKTNYLKNDTPSNKKI